MELIDIIKSTEYGGIKNMAYTIGTLERVLDKGVYEGVKYLLVEVKSLKDKTSVAYTHIILPDSETSLEKINNKELVFAQGILVATFGFNTNAVKHVFIKPDVVKVLEKDFETEKLKDFCLEYTKYNRIVLDCEVYNDTVEKLSKKGDRKFKSFKILFTDEKENSRTMACMIWDTIDGLPQIKKGDKIKIVGSMYIKDIKEKEGMKTHYTIYVQNILLNNVNAENLSQSLFK